jgi:amino acid transporter
MAGESKVPARNIGLSVIIASPIIVLMFMLGTASVLAFHELTGTTINYIAPIPQTLRLAFGDNALGTLVARAAILLLQLRILGACSFLFTGITRLPMAAGWDHLIPAWFSRLHPRYKTPTNSVLVATVLIAAFLLLASAGKRAAETFNMLNNAGSQFYVIAYLVMFAIPILGMKLFSNRVPRWVVMLSSIGFLVMVLTFFLNAYPFDGTDAPMPFAAKLLGLTAVINVVGYAFFRVRNRATGFVG